MRESSGALLRLVLVRGGSDADADNTLCEKRSLSCLTAVTPRSPISSQILAHTRQLSATRSPD
jgi:hypothetical protein